MCATLVHYTYSGKYSAIKNVFLHTYWLNKHYIMSQGIIIACEIMTTLELHSGIPVFGWRNSHLRGWGGGTIWKNLGESPSLQKNLKLSLKHCELPYFWLLFTYFGKYNLHCGRRKGWAEEGWSWKMGRVKERWRRMSRSQADCSMWTFFFFFNYLCL